jgi:hypothetical protein
MNFRCSVASVSNIVRRSKSIPRPYVDFRGRKRAFGTLLALVLLVSPCFANAQSTGASASAKSVSSSRRAQLVEANIVAVQAYQMILSRTAGDNPSACYPATPDTAALQELVKHQASLLAEPSAQVARWADSQQSSFDPSKDLEPLLHAGIPLSSELPVNVFTQYLQSILPDQPQQNVQSVANLYQVSLGIDRDGTVLQDLYRFYIALDLPVYLGQFGLPDSDTDLLLTAQQVYGKSCPSPVDLSVAAWQLTGRKIWNWGEKNLHVRDANTIAADLLNDPQVVPLVPAMKAMKPQKIAIIGDSYTMSIHWATPAPFSWIVTAMFARENPQVQFRQWSHGGLKFSRAYRDDYNQVLAWKPKMVLLAAEDHSPEDTASMKSMIEGFRAAGIRVLMFDDVEEPDADLDPAHVRRVMLLARQYGAEIIPSRAVLDASPLRGTFPAMDGIHKTAPYHRLMAVLWLQAILDSQSQSHCIGLPAELCHSK